MRVTFLWWTFEGYMAACWRELARRDGVQLSILALRRDENSEAPFDESILAGLNYELYSPGELSDPNYVQAAFVRNPPEVIVVPGWFIGSFRASMVNGNGARRRIMAIDTPWQGTLRQALGRWWYRRIFRRIDAVVAADERSAQLCRYLGFEQKRIYRPMYGHDYECFAPACARRLAQPSWPRQFVFVGRYVREKGIGVLLEAYARYRAESQNPWNLVCCGRGPLAAAIRRAAHVKDLGFRQPAELIDVMAASGCLVLPSLFEPWGVAIVEACAAGLPVICTDVCGAGRELIHDNGEIIAAGNAKALSSAMHRVEGNESRWSHLAERSQALARNFAPQGWADQWHRMLRECCEA